MFFYREGFHGDDDSRSSAPPSTRLTQEQVNGVLSEYFTFGDEPPASAQMYNLWTRPHCYRFPNLPPRPSVRHRRSPGGRRAKTEPAEKWGRNISTPATVHQTVTGRFAFQRSILRASASPREPVPALNRMTRTYAGRSRNPWQGNGVASEYFTFGDEPPASAQM
jgi:hypothetical protein